MRRLVLPLALVLLSAFGNAVARAQTKPDFSIPVWIDKGDCTKPPKFEPTLNGKPVPVSGQMSPASDQVILVVFDLTGDLSRIEDAKQAVTGDVSKLPRNIWVGVLRDQDGLHVLADPGPNRQKVIDAIHSLSVSGTPGLLETLRPALMLADSMIQKSPVRVAVLYVTDGSVYDYREDYTDPVINPSDDQDLSRRFRDVLINEKISKLVGHISFLEAPLFVVHLYYRQNRLDLAYQSGLDTLAKNTGGETVICHSTAEIPQAISHIFARITSAWRLNLAVAPKSHSYLQVGMRVACGSSSGLQLSWRPRFRLKGE
jgi:hypothetical protein